MVANQSLSVVEMVLEFVSLPGAVQTAPSPQTFSWMKMTNIKQTLISTQM